MQAQPQRPPQEVELELLYCEYRQRGERSDRRCGEPLFKGRLVKGSYITRRCHKCGNSTTIAA